MTPDFCDIMRRNTIGKLLIIALLLCCIAAVFLLFGKDIKQMSDPVAVKNAETMPVFLERKWEKNHDKNEDYIAQIVFDSGIIDLPVVQAYNGLYDRNGDYYIFYDDKGNEVKEDKACVDGCNGYYCDGNDVYLRTDWKSREYSAFGSNFFDYRNSFEDQNLIIYGHHASRSHFGDKKAQKQQFTILDTLMDEENYKDNAAFSLTFKDQIRNYVIVAVLKIDITDERCMQAYRINMDRDLEGGEDDGFFDEYLMIIEDNECYDTGVSLEKEDRFVTLSTCIEGDDNGRELIIAKEVSRKIYQ